MLFIRRTRVGLKVGECSAMPRVGCRAGEGWRRVGRRGGGMNRTGRCGAGDWEHEQYHATAWKHILQQANMLFCVYVCVCVSARIYNRSPLNSHTGHRVETIILWVNLSCCSQHESHTALTSSLFPAIHLHTHKKLLCVCVCIGGGGGDYVLI